jgi:hypothetical protein
MQLTASNLEKPAGSRVQLQKSEEKIKISLPPEGFTPKLIGLGAFAIAWNAFLLVWTGGAVSIPLWMSWFFLLFSLPFWFVGLGMLYQIIYCLKGEEIITIDRQEIVAIQRIWGLTLSGKKKMAREHINKLVISDGNRVYVPMALTIWAGTKEYTISSKTKEYLSEPEIEWLASELSQWLGIPITNRALNTLQEMQLTSSNLEKPAGSRVQLQKSEEKIKISLPPEGFTPDLIGIGFFSIFWNTFLLVLTGGVVVRRIDVWFLLFLLPFWFVGLGVSTFIIYRLIGEEIITIDRQEMVAIRRIFGWTIGKKKMEREHINRLVKADSYYDEDGDYVPMALTICAGTKEYTISSKTKKYLSEPEIEWLAAELSQWLGIPITNK